ncbi:Enolase-phosphatase E1 [Dissophora globulifera]|uniref:Enolase-phosphatase E1 n=1 Tax=Dissophora globulifera TaxID=979702 RepID=A0A9P6RDC3_9FUNG|nr:Enolase-phosphatase E1 [Dissophora globulifera]
MVLTRSKSNPQAAVAPKAAAPTKRKSAASAPKAKAAKTDAAPDLAAAKDPLAAGVAASDVAAVPAAMTTAATTEANPPATLVAQPPAPTAPATATIPAPVEVPLVAPAAALGVASIEEPTVHNGLAAGSAIHPYDVVVSDIEGTTTPIVFVKENLFPYVTNNLPDFLKRNWASDEMTSAVEALRAQATKDLADGLSTATPIATESDVISAEKVQQDVIASIAWQMAADRKIGPLKAFQGYMWREGYGNGDLKGDIYDDVVPAFDQWKAEGKKLYIYSSGSVPAQKLIFGFSKKGDMLHYFSGYYDTDIGHKVQAESYSKIASDIGVAPSKILFLSDNIHEIVAAKKAGLQAVVLDRPGNAELTPDDRAGNIVVKSFLEIPKAH